MPAHSDVQLPPIPPNELIAQGSSAKVEVCTDVDKTKADSDKKSYRLIRLSNGLRALLIHDPPVLRPEVGSGHDDDDEDDEDEDLDNDEDDDDEDDDDKSDIAEPGGVKKAAAAMAVGVGYVSDPENCQGLAHYLEHMLFMGSTKYPDENEYDSFISQRGGSSNAFTECEHTLFYFDIFPEHLEKGLDIFAQFFVSPLLKADSSDRELQSIESEFCLSKNSDSCRLQELWCHTAKPDHPFSKFSWGNLWSLRDLPNSKGVDVRQELVEFHAKHYRAPSMQLVVLGAQSLDELQAMVVNSFSAVADGGPSTTRVSRNIDQAKGNGLAKLPPESVALAAAGMPFAETTLGRLFRVQPVKEVHRLHVSWQLEEQLSSYKTKPCDYLGHLIGHEGEGSILTLLRHKHWATGVSAGIHGMGYSSSSCHAIFSITFNVTKAGARNWHNIAMILFSYIGMLKRKGPQDWIYREIRDVADLQYRFQQECEPAETVEQLAHQMLPYTRHEERHILNGPYLVEEWDPDVVQKILEKFTPASARYDLQSSIFGRAVDAATTEKERGDEDDGDDDGEEDEGGEDEDEDEDDEDGDEEDGDEEEAEDEEEDDSSEDFHELSKKSDEAPLQEPRFGLKFWNDPIPTEFLESWTALSTSSNPEDANALSRIPTDMSGGGLDSQPVLSLPKPNPFIPSEFTIKASMNGSTAVRRTSDDASGNDKGQTQKVSTGRSKGENRGKPEVVPVKKMKPTDKEPVANVQAGPPCPRLVKETVSDDTVGRGKTKVSMWHLQDSIFLQPRAELYLKVVTPVGNEDPLSAALSELLVRLVNDSLTEYTYAAYVAELQYNLKATGLGFQAHVYGFDHKAPLMLRKILERLLNLGPALKEGPLLMHLEALMREYQNTDMRPGKHVCNARIQALRPGNWSADQKQAALCAKSTAKGSTLPSSTTRSAPAESTSLSKGAMATISVSDLKLFIERLFSRIEIECLVHGNFTEADTFKIFDDIEEVAKTVGSITKDESSTSAVFKYPEERVVRLVDTQHVVYCCASKDPTEQNCSLEVYWQMGENNLKERVVLDAIEQVMDEPFYDQLRTKEQLGYSVSCSIRVTYGVLGFCVAAQSAAYGPAYLHARIRAFMISFRDTLAEMSEDTFSQHMSSAAANKLQPDNTLSEEAQRHWPEINSHRHAFNMNIQYALGLRSLKQADVLKAYEEWFSTGPRKSRGKPCFTLMVAGAGKFDAEKEVAALRKEIDEDRIGDAPCFLRIAAPDKLYDPTKGRDMFPNFYY